MVHKAKSPPVATGGTPQLRSCWLAEGNSDDTAIVAPSQASLPSKATLARRWPRLRINRLTGRWRDDATGAKGDNIESLLAFLFLGEGTR